jgi:hypothetical protein
MEGLSFGRGSQKVEREVLDLVPMPDATDTYVPVSHFHLADRLKTIGQDILTDYALVGENYALARQGQQLFALLKFQNDNSGMALSVGFRNSYDRSMSIGLAVGANVFVCDNLMLTGEIAVMKKHTKNVWDSLEDLAITTLYKSDKNFHQLVADSEFLKGRQLATEEGFKTMGLLFGQGILSPRQMSTVKAEWLHPSHEEFQPRNEWTFYNACTEALKSSAPNGIMEKHIKLHNALVDRDKPF